MDDKPNVEFLTEDEFEKRHGKIPPPIDDYLDKMERYRISLASTPNPHDQVISDIKKRLDDLEITDDSFELIHRMMFLPIDENVQSFGVLGYEWAVKLYFRGKINDLFHVLVEDVEQIKDDFIYDKNNQVVGVDPRFDEVNSEIDTIINNKIAELGLTEMPPEIEKRLTKDQRKVLGLLEKISKQQPKGKYRKTRNSSDFQALQSVVNIKRSLLMNPNQMSMFDDGIEVDTWDNSETGSKDAREISVKKKSINGSNMVLHYGVEDFRSLLKHNEQASKLLTFYAERLQDEFDINEYAELLGMRSDHAKRSLHNGAKVLTSIKYELSGNGGFIVIFPSIVIGEHTDRNGKKVGKRGKVTIEKSSRIDFSSGGERFKLIPEWSYRLNKNAWFLADYIYSVYRMDAKNIDQSRGYHIKTISLLSILSVLNLPHPDKTDRVDQLIIKPLQKAIDEFNQAEIENGGGMRLSLNLDYQKSPSVRVKDGQLIARLDKCEYFDILVEIPSRMTKHLDKATKKAQQKQDKIDQAKGRQLARLEYEDKKKEAKNEKSDQ